MSGNDITKKDVTLYYAEWCGHCVTFKPEWFKFKAAYNNAKNEIKDKYKITLVLNEYESDSNPGKISEAGVDGFPTIKIKYHDKVDDYIGERTALALFKRLVQTPQDDEIMSWLNKVNDEQPIYGEVSMENKGSTTNQNLLPQIQMGGILGIKNYGLKASDPKILFANSYRKYMKYKNKCERSGLINKSYSARV